MQHNCRGQLLQTFGTEGCCKDQHDGPRLQGTGVEETEVTQNGPDPNTEMLVIDSKKGAFCCLGTVDAKLLQKNHHVKGGINVRAELQFKFHKDSSLLRTAGSVKKIDTKPWNLELVCFGR